MTQYATIATPGIDKFDPSNGLDPVVRGFSTAYANPADATTVQQAAAVAGVDIIITALPLTTIWPGGGPADIDFIAALAAQVAAYIAGGGGGGGTNDPNAVHFNAAQTLTGTQKTQALTNVGGASTATVDQRTFVGVKAAVSTSTTLVSGWINPVDATSGALTSTLPSAVTAGAGAQIAAYKVDGSLNAVNLTGSIRGASTSIALTLQFQALELVSDGASWYPKAGHLTLGTLDLRYSTTGVAASNYAALIQFYAALSNRENAKCDIIYGPGDSLGEGYPATSWERTPGGWLQQLMRQRFKLPDNPIPSMSAVGNDRGFVGIPGSAILATGINNPFPWTFVGGTNNSTSGWGAKFASWIGSAAGHKAQIPAPTGGLTSFDIMHVTGASGGASGGYYKIGAAAAVVFSTLAGSTTAAVLHVATAVTAGTVIEIGFNGTGGVLLTGIREYSNTEAASISVHNCCIGGAQASTWTTTHPAGGWPQAMANLNPDAIVMELGGNEYLNAIASATFKTNVLALIALIRAAGMSCPIVLSLPYNGPATVGGGEPLSAFVTRAKEIAAADPTVIVLDNSVRMPATNAANTFGLYHSDGVHGNANGNAYALMAESLAATISPQ